MGVAIPSSNRRRRWIVNAPFQLRIVGLLVAGLLTLAVAVLMGLYLAIWAVLYTFELQHEDIYVQLFKNVGLVATAEILVCLPIIVWALMWVGVIWTHRIAGPLVRIMVAVEQMAHGNFDVHLNLRKHDGLQDLARDINRLAAYLRSRFPSSPAS